MAPGEKTRTVPPGAVRTRRMALLMLLGLVTRALLPFPWNIVALVPLGYGMLEGLRAMRELRDGGAGVMSQLWAAAGVAILAVMTLTVLLPFATFSSSMEYQSCLDGANTGVARAQCRQGLLGQLGIL